MTKMISKNLHDAAIYLDAHSNPSILRCGTLILYDPLLQEKAQVINVKIPYFIPPNRHL